MSNSTADVLQHTEAPQAQPVDLFRTFRRSNSNYATAPPARRMSVATEQRLARKKEERKKAIKEYFLGLFPP
jgi:hypothetical protein